AMAMLAFAADARAQNEPDDHLQRGLRYYTTQDYERAIEEFRAGFTLDPRREFLFALGQAERLSGDCGSAILYYQAFLRAQPAAAQADAAREQIQVCHLLLSTEKPKRRALAHDSIDRDEPPPLVRQRRALAPAPAPARIDDTPAWYSDVTGDALLGGGVVMLALGGGLWAASVSAASAADGAATYPEYDALIGRARTRRTLALTAGAAGTALVGAAIWRFRWGRGHHRAAVALSPGGGQVGLALGGDF
ncbi:MAG TPA: hypothetical protein VL172_23190, partial [Kofleriaceae bacterium]|nr:hypothetical protein [Kofleriaceae bacterium]